MRRILAAAFLLCSGCALHRAGMWQLARHGDGHVLVPPDVSRPDLTHRQFAPPVAVHACPDSAIPTAEHRKHARLAVTRDALMKQPAGSLAAAASRWEAEGCVAPGDGMKLATAIAQSVPLDPILAFGLLYGDRRSPGVDLDEATVLQVLSPILRDPRGERLETPTATGGSDSSITLSAKASDNLLGYETGVYRLRPGQHGFRIAPVSTTFHDIATGADQTRATPSLDLFAFPPDAAFYRLFYESWRNDFSAVLIAAASRAELERTAAKFEAIGASGSCRDLDTAMCVQVPKEVAVNAFVSVTANGKEMLITRGTSVGQVMRTARAPNPEALLPALQVLKWWSGRRVSVRFDPSDPAILALPLQGGEIISWRSVAQAPASSFHPPAPSFPAPPPHSASAATESSDSQ